MFIFKSEIFFKVIFFCYFVSGSQNISSLDSEIDSEGNMKVASRVISCIDPLGSMPFKTLDPFLFCVYHKDVYPAGDAKMQAPRKGNGADFNPEAPYRMYHGDRIPGFPQHPHRGLETVTATIEGLIDHADSLGNAGRYGQGDLQWMTSGRGIVHGEMFPLVKQDAPNICRFFQIWLNLPRKSKMCYPAFAMHWSENIPHIRSADGLSDVTVWAGTLAETQGLAPPPDSYACSADSDIGIYLVRLSPGGSYNLSAASRGEGTNRVAYFVEGAVLHIDETVISKRSAITLKAQHSVIFSNPSSSSTVAEILVLQGHPIGEPVAHHGPFVMNTEAELRQAYMDYQQTQFGGWPWKEDAVVFPRDKGRFSLSNSTETRPPATGGDL